LLQQRFNLYAELPQYDGFYLYQNTSILVAHEKNVQLPDNFESYPYIKSVLAEQETFILIVVSNEQALPDILLLMDYYWLLILIIMLLLGLFGFIGGNKVGRKVDELIVGISKAGGGNYTQRVSGSSNDEISQLVISYNRMLDNMLSGSQEIKEQLQNYKTILANAAEGIISINDRGVIQEYNNSAEAIFGYPYEEIIGKNITKLIPSKITLEQGIEKEQSFEAEGESIITREYIGVRKNEQHFPIELSVSETTINNAQVCTGIIRDITDRKQSESKQQNLELQLRKLQRLSSLEHLSGGITHDFNNILGPILGYADMALNEAEEGTRLHKYLTNILYSAQRARKLVAKIMSFSRQSEHDREQLHISTIIEDSLELIKSSLPAEHQIETFLNSSNDLVAAERTQLSQVLVAIVTNASQAMSNGAGTLTLRLDNIVTDENLLAKSEHLHGGEYVRLRIQDTGIGMNSSTRSKIFEPFFSARENNERIGLGLSVAYGIIQSFDGEILVESEPGEGTVISIFIPVANKNERRMESVSTDKHLSKKGELILYIDDDKDIIELGKEMLENLGYEVETSISSEKALLMFQNDPEDFDLIITDQSMPVLTGIQLARELKRIRADIPIILVSGFSTTILNNELVDTGISHCIAKPLVVDELGKIVLQALAERES
ncbi:MAG: PAS domain S-box protein, partial [Gammaproteobacteria bacterium]|nr:PAS domain S-box protein [Gammaproteobacteria bacterium]